MKKQTNSAAVQTNESVAVNSNYEVTAPSGRIYLLQPIPKHFYFFYSELPGGLSERAAKAMESGDNAALGEELLKQMSPDQLQKTLIFVREAVKYAMVSPRLTLTPSGPDEISPFQMDEKDFEFLSTVVMQGGEQAKNLSGFRG